MKIMYLILLFLLMSGCGGKNESLNHCDPSVPHTLLTHENYAIYIQNPDDAKNPTIWEGPICIDSETSDEQCVFEESLISIVEPNLNSKIIHITTFSGSQSSQWQLDLVSCQTSKMN